MRNGSRSEIDGPLDRPVEHGGRETTGLGVLLADVVAADESRVRRGHEELGLVREVGSRARRAMAASPQIAEIGAPGDGSEREHHPRVSERVDFSVEEGGAPLQLLRVGAVSRGSAPGRHENVSAP